MASLLPYPGLRSFRPDEWPIFFGRDRCIDAMIERLAATRFLAVLGASGSGKSSLVHTGLLHTLGLGFFSGAGSRWTFVHCRPGGGPLGNLAQALARSQNPNPAPIDIQVVRAMLARGPRALVEWCASGGLKPGRNLLVVVDQFEELFRYTNYATREQAEVFVSLLLESARSAEVPIYVVLTMRSEFLGACSLLPELAEQINRGFYLTPRMSREECREAIVGPADSFGFTIEPTLVNQLLNDMASFAPWEDKQGIEHSEELSRRADQLPMMQHLLNRMWLKASAGGTAKDVFLTRQEYDSIGGLAGALDRHGDEVAASLSPAACADLEVVFRALVTGSSPLTAVRHPTPFAQLAALTKGGIATATEIVETFRGRDCNFLEPPTGTPIESATNIDITHESLIRQWKKLEHWLKNEAQAGDNWHELRRRADRWHELTRHAERADDAPGMLLTGRDLAYMSQWWEDESPTEAWAVRYGDGFAEVQAFLDASIQAKDDADKAAAAAEKIKRDERLAAERTARTRRWTAAILGVAALGALSTFMVHTASRNRQIRAENEVRDRVIGQGQVEIAKRTAIITDMSKNKAELDIEIAALKSQLNDSGSRITLMNNEKRLLASQRADLIQQGTVLQTQVGDLLKENSDLRSKVAQTADEVQQEKDRMAAIALERDKFKASLAAIAAPPKPAPTASAPPAIPHVIVYVASGIKDGDATVYRDRPEVYIDSHPVAYVQPHTYFSVSLPAGQHRFCVADPYVDCNLLELQVPAGTSYVQVQYLPAASKRSPGMYVPQPGDAASRSSTRIDPKNIIDPLKVDP